MSSLFKLHFSTPTRFIFNLHSFPFPEYQWKIPVSFYVLEPCPLSGLLNSSYCNPTLPRSVEIPPPTISLIFLHSYWEVIACKTLCTSLLALFPIYYCLSIPLTPLSSSPQAPFFILLKAFKYPKKTIIRIVIHCQSLILTQNKTVMMN